MKKVAVVGCGGSGKSHLARQLGGILGAPVTHLDAVYYDDEWNALPKEKFAARQQELVARPSWVIDGNYNSTLPIRLEACDTVVLMDVPTLAALWGIASRQIRHGAGHKGNGVHNRITRAVIRYVITYRRRMRPRVMAKIDEYARDHAQVVLLRGRRHTRRWLEEVAAHHAGV
jgi:adenylate kinase family enzyme